MLNRNDAPTVAISSRRYLGNKTRLLPFIEQVVLSEIGPIHSFADIFAGTGVVAHHFNNPDTPVIANDLLHSNYMSLRSFLEAQKEDLKEIPERLQYLEALSPSPGYAAQHFGGAYFSQETAAHIDVIREQIAQWKGLKAISEAQEAVLVTSLLYAVDRLANTCGHYDAFLRKQARGGVLRLTMPRIDANFNAGNRILNMDANALAEKLAVDVLYLDPPYNSRQYSDTYHLLENLARWHKPAVRGVARKMDRKHIKSRYCSKRQAPIAFKHLIDSVHCNYILLSYNNMAGRGDERSNARINDSDILQILSNRGEVQVFQTNHKAFSAGLADHSLNHQERLFLCRVQHPPVQSNAKRIQLPMSR